MKTLLFNRKLGTTNPTFVAVFSTTSVQVNAQDVGGNPVTGYAVPLSQNGNVVKQGFTPTVYGLTSGSTYTITPNDFTLYFNHWSDAFDSWDGARTRTVMLTGPQSPTYTSVYYTSPAQGFEITSTDWDNHPLTGFYVPINPCGGGNQCSAFTPAWFTLLYGTSYTVTPSDFGNYYFNSWQDTGSIIRARSIAPSTSLPAYNAVYRICEDVLQPNNHHCYAKEDGASINNVALQFNTTVTNIQPSNNCNFITVEEWDVFPNGDWVETGFVTGNIQGKCVITQESYHAYSISNLNPTYQEFDDATVKQGSWHIYMVYDAGQKSWQYFDNGTLRGSVTALYDTAAQGQVGTETSDPNPSIPPTSQQQIRYLVGSTWQYWAPDGFMNNEDYPPVWVSNCSDYPYQHITVGTGAQGSC